MAIKILDAERALRPETIDYVWPGDDAVDLDQSNLDRWLTEGGKAGLVFNDNPPTEIKMRKLEPDERQYVIGLYADKTDRSLMFLRTFQIGVMSISGVTISRTDVAGGIQLMARHQLNALMGEVWTFVDKDGKETSRSLPDVIGNQIFSLSFRD